MRVEAWKSAGLVATQAKEARDLRLCPKIIEIRQAPRELGLAVMGVEALWQIWCSRTVPSRAPPFSFGVR